MLSSWASSVIHQNLLHCVHLYLLSTAIFCTRFYCYDDPSCVLCFSLLLSDCWLPSVECLIYGWQIEHPSLVFHDSWLTIPIPWYFFFPCEFTGKTPFLFKFTFWCIILWKSDCTEKALMIFLNYFEVMFDRSTLYNQFFIGILWWGSWQVEKH